MSSAFKVEFMYLTKQLQYESTAAAGQLRGQQTMCKTYSILQIQDQDRQSLQ